MSLVPPFTEVNARDGEGNEAVRIEHNIEGYFGPYIDRLLQSDLGTDGDQGSSLDEDREWVNGELVKGEWFRTAA